MTQNELKKPRNKKLFIILGSAAGALILAVIAAIVFFSLTAVSKEDYRDATLQFNKVSRASSSLNRSASSLTSGVSTASVSEFDSRVKEFEDAMNTVKAENEVLGGMKAVQFGDGKELYSTFDEKVEGYTGFAQEVTDSVKKMRPALLTCDAVGDADTNEARAAAMKTCSDELGSIGTLSEPNMNTYVDSLKTNYGQYAETLKEMAALASPFGDDYEQYKVLRDKNYDIQENIRDATRTFNDALEARDDELNIKDAATALGEHLTEQQK